MWHLNVVLRRFKISSGTGVDSVAVVMASILSSIHAILLASE